MHARTHKHRKATERLTGNAITVCQGALLVCKAANFTAILQNQQVTSNHIDTLMLCRSAAPVCGRLFFFFFFGNLIRLIVYKPIQPVHRSCGPLGGVGGGRPPPPPRFVERRLSNTVSTGISYPGTAGSPLAVVTRCFSGAPEAPVKSAQVVKGNASP